MPLPSGWTGIIGTPELIALDSYIAGTYVSDDMLAEMSYPIGDCQLLVCITAMTSTASLEAGLEWSSDGITWASVLGSNIPTLSAVGSEISNAAVTNLSHLRATSTVTGYGEITYRIVAFLSTT